MNMLNEFYVNNVGNRAKLVMSFSCVKLLNLQPDLCVFNSFLGHVPILYVLKILENLYFFRFLLFSRGIKYIYAPPP